MGTIREDLEQLRADQGRREAGEPTVASQTEGRADDGIGRAIRVAEEMDRQRAQREARRRLDAEERGPVVMPEMRTLRERLSGPPVPVAYRIAEIQPRDTRVMLAAQ